MKYFIESNNEKFSVQLTTFATELPSYSAILGFTNADEKEAKEDAAYMAWAVESANQVDNYQQEVFAFLDIVRYGAKGVEELNPPPPPVLAAPPAAVPPDIELRFQEKARRAKAAKGYTRSIGEKLGIVGDDTEFNPKEGKPKLKVSLDAGYPFVVTSKGRYPGINLYRDMGTGYGDKPYKTLTTPKFRDEDCLPAAGQSRIIKYKAIFVWDNKEVGDWSDEVSITVAGK